MSEWSDARLRLSEFLGELEAELGKARSQTEKDNLTYHMDEVTLELDIACTLTKSAESPTKVKPEFWVLGCGSRNAEEGLPSQCNVQRLILRLTPRLKVMPAGGSEHVEEISRLPPERPQMSKNSSRVQRSNLR
jgi:hypothetical protein